MEATRDPEYWRCDYHHGRLRLVNGSPEAKLLARESHQLIHEIEDFLKASQLALALNTMSVRDAIPTLKINVAGDPPTAQLQSFVKLVCHSMKLNAWPEVKTAFWLTISAMQQQFTPAPQVTAQLIPDPAFPRFMLCIGSRPQYGQPALLSQALCDAVSDVLTTPETETAAKPSLELSFGHYELMFHRTREEMELIESLLDRVLRSPTLQFKVSMLDFTNSVMVDALIEVAARIVAKCTSGFYQIEQINMEGVIPWHGYGGIYSPGETPREFRDLALSAFGVDSLPRFWSFQPPAIAAIGDVTEPSVLQKISLAGNALTPNFFAQHFSTLRYGCPLVEDLTGYSVDTVPRHLEIHVDCWRWIAFGLFYPRPKRFAQAYKLRSLGKLTVDSVAIRAIANTLRNPVAQLVYNDLEGTNTPPPDYLMVCTVKEGASIEVFVSGVKHEYVFVEEYQQHMLPIEPWHKTLLETSEFEALCEREDGSVCVVVPGAGLGWVSKEDVVLLEREPLELAWQSLDGMYDMTIGNGREPTPVGELRSLFQAIGPQIKSLSFAFAFHERHIAGPYTFTYSSSEQTVVRFIQDHCTSLKHLKLDEASEMERSALWLALESSDLRTRLLTLNLNKSIDDAGLVRLAAVLAGTNETPLALQELRVNCYSDSAAPIASLYDLLSSNRTLRVLEVNQTRQETHPQMVERCRERLDEEARLDAAFQSQLLDSYSPMDVKMAFLSVVNDQFATTPSHGKDDRLALPEILLSKILAFAASIETRRMIAWNPCGVYVPRH